MAKRVAKTPTIIPTGPVRALKTPPRPPTLPASPVNEPPRPPTRPASPVNTPPSLPATPVIEASLGPIAATTPPIDAKTPAAPANIAPKLIGGNLISSREKTSRTWVTFCRAAATKVFSLAGIVAMAAVIRGIACSIPRPIASNSGCNC